MKHVLFEAARAADARSIVASQRSAGVVGKRTGIRGGHLEPNLSLGASLGHRTAAGEPLPTLYVTVPCTRLEAWTQGSRDGRCATPQRSVIGLLRRTS
jgi:hypothetical protein